MTIKDIARMAGVSHTTVSLILNNKRATFSLETCEKVIRIAKEGGYSPYSRTNQNTDLHSGLLGVLVPESTGVFSEFVAGAEETASADGYAILLCAEQNDADEIKKHLSNLFSKDVDGVTLYIPEPMDIKAFLADAPEKLKCTLVSNSQSTLEYCDVHSSYAQAVHIGVDCLLDLGHKNIALLGNKEDPLVADFLAGYGDALYNHETVVRDELIYLCDSIKDIAEIAKQITYGKASAILCADTQIAMHLYHEFERYGIQVPKDYSVLSISGEHWPVDLFVPSLATVNLQFRELGSFAIRSLISKIERGTKGEREVPQKVAPQLRLGASVAPPSAIRGKRIVVVGSMNMDIIIHTSHIPTSGESLLSQKITNLPGGKGANQAIGAAKLGGDVCAIGCLGGDQDGRLIYHSLDENGVNMAGVQTIQHKATGKAYILVAQNGESTIVLSHGTNRELTPSVIEQNSCRFEGAQFCLISTEIPWNTVEYTIDLCVRNDVKIILKPTVQMPITPEILRKVTYLIPNEKELLVQDGDLLSVEEKADKLFALGVENVIITLGDKGCYLRNAETARVFPAADFIAVDTTGAADAFISAFAVYLSEGHSIVSSIKFATYAAGISVTRDGVQPALAGRMALDMYADKYGAHWPS